jgi:SAM-dependent methyltransferase
MIINSGLLKTGSSKSAESIGDGRADLITATNVFAHVDNVHEFIQACRYVLKPTGILVLEFPYLIDFIENGEFDTVYFEHLSYFSIHPLYLLCRDEGLQILNVENQAIHGGSVRVTIGHGEPDASVGSFMKLERSLFADIYPYQQFADDVAESIEKFRDGLHSLPLGSKVAGFAASAKGNTLLNSALITVGTMKYIVDETPEKIGKYSPGTGIPIVSLLDMMRNPPDYMVLLSWNFAYECMQKCRLAGYEGKFIIPIPKFKIIN